MYRPTWHSIFKRLNPDPELMNAEGERRAVDAMLEEKEKQLQYSQRAREYEAGRKKEAGEQKAYKRREQRLYQMKVDDAKKKALEFLKIRSKK